MVGITQLKNTALVLAQFGQAIENSLEGGFQLSDLGNLILPLSQLPAVIQNKEAIVEEFKDLDAAERQELLAYVGQTLDLKNDKVENIVEKGLAAAVSIIELVAAFKKEETPELPE